jgi:hypothetical protein
MRSPCDPPKFDEQDWGEFDFTRWHLEGLAGGDAIITALADLTQRLVATPEWRQHFGAAASELQEIGREFYQQHLAGLRKEQEVLQLDFKARTDAAQEQVGHYRRTLAASAEPPSVEPDPATYRLAVKVTGGTEAAGLGGLLVQVIDPENERTALVEGVTDSDGNATLSVPPERARERNDAHATLTVRTLDGTSLQVLKEAICIRLNQTDTKVVRLAESEQVAPYIAASLEARAARERLLLNLMSRVDRLQDERDARLRDLDCRVKNTEELIADFDHPPVIPIEAIDRRGAAAGAVMPEARPRETAQPGEAGPELPKGQPQSPKGRKRKPPRGKQ